MPLVRKVNLGKDYKDSMCYSVGQEVYGGHTIVEIVKLEDGGCEIYIENNEGVKLWKAPNSGVGITFEYNIDY